ncbi:penicillin-binding protein 2 [Ursidibacter maritimus]|uniref:Peptidoglycan D,D-transpeptidase MrdA n=1 Tax=Ursidibacter maritimus TaxID=1331689 RepID=A0A949WNR6_9PAST|nr:penicillin-binding protein 2 [Ursidibacter maritimus]KAE9538699.1 penicillin-binding protein 2 [Ursidibacter maritimus]MBV6523317.1 penicillin-binding protein 2 [Ursidibacter maritimus]MBV6525936.1 penicillin-binding protein 2 [Ursidibacter maritimus]MBV6527723.1 penicillin-binding protein 2 [Ursidibacter maritimus]MBV6529474.1 penicillin-binding protein 2 [Ursidibacter maritimus]
MFGKLSKFSSPKQREKIRNGQAEKNLFVRRALIAFLGVLGLTGVLLTNLYHLQVRDYDTYQTRSNGNRIKLLPIPPVRGLIYDRNGKVLAENLTFFGLYIVPEKVNNLDETLLELKSLVGLTDEDIENFRKERARSSRYTPILLKPNLTEDQIARFSVNQYRFPSLDVQPYFKRTYPYGDVLTHILGYVAKINDKDKQRLQDEGKFGNYAGSHDIGKLGIEKFYEEQLHGQTGFEEVEINNRGKVIRKLRDQPAVAGGSIRLTLDVELQQYISSLIGNEKGAIVVLDPKDSSILAMVTNPSYDNNLFVDGISGKDYKQLLDDEARPLYSRATQGTYPPASTIKPFMAVAGLTENKITSGSTVFDPGYWILPGTTQRFRDWKRSGHGRTDINKAIVESSDTYFYQLAYDMGIDKMSDWMKRFGFGVKTGIDLAEESTGIMPSREWKQKRYKKQPWLAADTINAGIGQGYWISTPLQLAKATAVLINNGKVNTPHLMMEVMSIENMPYQDPLLYDDIKDVPPRFWQIAKLGMYNVLHASNGTGRKAFAGVPYRAAGKTGTAQVKSLKGKDYDKNAIAKKYHDHAWFIGYAPYDNPKMVVSIILENAGGGGSTAAPIARKIMDYMLLRSNTANAELQKNEQNSPLNLDEINNE